MKVTNILFFGAIAAGGVYLLTRFSQNVLYDFRGLKWLGLDGLRMRFAIIYDLKNNNDTSTTVNSLKGRLNYGDYKLSDLTIDQPVVLAPGQSERMEVKFSVSPGTLLAEILRFIEQKEGFSKFRLKGTLSGKIGDVPYIYPINEILQMAE